MQREGTGLAMKIATAVSVVHLLNAGAAVVLPYVNATRDAATAGGHVETRSDSLAHAVYGTAHAASVTTTVPNGEAATETRASMRSGDTQTIYEGGTGMVTAMKGGFQYVSGGIGSVTTMSGGGQFVYDGGSGGVETMRGGSQAVFGGGKGTVKAMDGGRQAIYSNGDGTVLTMDGGTQNICERGAVGTVEIMNDGAQNISSGSGKGTVGVMNGGTQTIYSGGTGGIGSMRGGTLVMETGGVFSGSLSGYGTVSGALSLGAEQGVVVSGGVLTADHDLGAGTVSVASGGRLAVAGNVGAETIQLAGLPVDGGAFVSAGGGVSVHMIDIAALDTESRSGFTLVTAGSAMAGGTLVHDGGSQMTFSTAATVAATSVPVDDVNGTTIEATRSYTVALSEDAKALSFTRHPSRYTRISFGAMHWDEGCAFTPEAGYGFAAGAIIDAAALSLSLTNAQAGALRAGGETVLLSAPGLSAAQTVAAGRQAPAQTVAYTDRGIRFEATASGHVAATTDAVTYAADRVTLNRVHLADWNGETGAIPPTWTGTGVAVATGRFDAPRGLAAGAKRAILASSTAGFFGDVTGDNAYQEDEAFAETSPENGVTLAGCRVGGVKAENGGRELNYYAMKKSVTTVILGETEWGTGRTVGAEYDFTGVTGENVNADALSFRRPESVAAGETPLLTAANATLARMGAREKHIPYRNRPVVPGVTMDGRILGRYGASDGKMTYEATQNVATKLTFGEVRWLTDGALIDHGTTLTNVSFNGAAVDTTNIAFMNVDALEAHAKMTLVKAFGGTAGEIAGTTYHVGAALKGEGKASLSDGGDLIFTVGTGTAADGKAADEPDVPDVPHVPDKPDAADTSGNVEPEAPDTPDKPPTRPDAPDVPLPVPSEPKPEDPGRPEWTPEAFTHHALMGAEVSLAALAAGNDFIGNATEGLALAGNIGADGVSTYAQMGGGTMRQETGSHVDTRTWNAILALGHKNEKEKSTTQYGAFFEYGTGNYTTHNDNERGDGSMRYTGGGLLGKWKRESGFYLEGSLRAGTVRDDAHSVLRDAAGNPYSYDTSAGYWGVHLGLGKEIALANGNVLDLYGKYFRNRRNGVSFDAGGNHYALDAVTSSVLRVGARYTMKRETWNYYGGLAYEHELDGVAAGTVDGLAIRAAETKGGSARLELGATMTPDHAPWSLDLSLTGFAGQKRGLMGGVSVAFMF